MFAYPKQSEFNRPVPKTKIYAHAKVSKRMKELFAAQVGEILWKYKLSPETINLPARHGIREIQVFELSLKTPDFDSDLLEVIDKAIPFPLLFQLTHEKEIWFAASYKRRHEAIRSKWVIEARFQTDRQAIDAPRPPLPMALDLAALYEQIIRRHIPLPPRDGEDLAAHVARFNELEAKKEAQRQLQAKLGQEKQFNRRVELNAALRSLKHELAALAQP